MSSVRRLLHRLVSLGRHARAEDELQREISSHLQLLEDEFMARGMTAHEARCAARRAFGGVEQAKERQRDARSIRWLAGWSMDLRLAARMLYKYPGLTIVGGLATAFAIAVGAAAFEVVTQVMSPSLPLPGGDRIVAIRAWDTAANAQQSRVLADLPGWRAQLELVEHLGAFRTVERNMILADGRAEPVTIAEITASAFVVTQTAPAMGRLLVDSDALRGAAPVVVIGHDVWRRTFAGDPAVVGKTVRLGRDTVSIVGVMPEGFGFPVAHSAWVPLKVSGVSAPRSGPEVTVFGRLADGVSLEQIQGRLEVVASRAAAASPDTHGQIRLEVLPFARAIVDVSEIAMGVTAVKVFVLMFVVLVCANVGSLVFARAVTRHDEILVRHALGASRGRIVAQLFAESLVLGGVAALPGLAAAAFAIRWWFAVFEADAGTALPFWMHASLSPWTLLYACVLTIGAAAIAGVLPAMKITKRSLDRRLRERAASTADLSFGGVWTAVIVAQVAATVAFPATAFFARQYVSGVRALEPGFAAQEYLSARLEVDTAEASFASVQDDAVPAPTYRQRIEELRRRLQNDARVLGVTFADRLPRTVHRQRRVEVEESDAAELRVAERINSATVAHDFFRVLGAGVLSGRGFQPSETVPVSRAVIVNQSFVERVLGNQDPLGRRMRYAATRGQQASPWFEIIGVVRDLGMIHDDPQNGAGVYHPMDAGSVFPIHLAIHVRGEPETFSGTLRELTAAVDPTLRLYHVLPLDDVGANLWLELNFVFEILVLITAIAILLSLAGIYAVLSLTVSRRTQEIGIRMALGAARRQIVAAVLARTFRRVAAGVAAGGILVALLTHLIGDLSLLDALVVIAYVALMAAVCLLAAVVPLRRALGVQPIEALRIQ